MVRTEADMIVIVSTTTSTTTTSSTTKVSSTTSSIEWFFSTKRLWYPTYQYNDDYEDERMAYGRRRGFANPNPNRRGEFPNPNRRNMLPNFIRDQRGGYSNLDEFLILFLLLMGVMMLSQHCFGSRKLIICLTWSTFSWKITSNLWFINLKEGLWYGELRMYQDKSPIRTWSRMKRILQVYNFALEEEELENRPRPFMRFYQLNEIVQGIPIREKLFIGGNLNGMWELVVMSLIVYMEDLVLGKEMNHIMRF